MKILGKISLILAQSVYISSKYHTISSILVKQILAQQSPLPGWKQLTFQAIFCMGRPLPWEGTFGYWSAWVDFREGGLTAKSSPPSIPAIILKYLHVRRPSYLPSHTTRKHLRSWLWPINQHVMCQCCPVSYCPAVWQVSLIAYHQQRSFLYFLLSE